MSSVFFIPIFVALLDSHGLLRNIEAFAAEGTLSTLSVAFSRAQQEKQYVQHKMAQGDMPAKIWACLKAGGYFYICGCALPYSSSSFLVSISP